jgi:nucleoside-diphosphate-sugar epimerase
MIEDKNKSLSIIFTGTRDQYGKVPYNELPIKEDFLPRSFTDYQSVSKSAAEAHHLILYSSLKEHGVKNCKITSARLTNTYGPRQSLSYGAVAPVFINKIIKGETIELWGGGEVLRDFNYIDDVVEALLFLAASDETGGQVYNLGCCIKSNGVIAELPGGNLKTINQLAETIIKIVGKGFIKEIPYPLERKNIEPGHSCSDISKIFKLGWRPKTSLEQGIRNTIEFIKENQTIT